MTPERYYPIYLSVKNLPCLIVGGGKVAERKAETLAEAGAAITVVSPDATPKIARMAREGLLRWLKARYRTADLNGVRLVMGATDNPAVNEKIFADAEARGILVNIVDCPSLCRFIVPAVAECRDVSVAVSTGGGAPGMSALMRRELEKGFIRRYAPMVAALKKLRERIRKLPPPQKKRFWKKVKTGFDSLPTSNQRAIERILMKWLAPAETGRK